MEMIHRSCDSGLKSPSRVLQSPDYCSMRRGFAHTENMTRHRRLRASSAHALLCVFALVGAMTTMFAQGNQTLRVVPLVKDDHVLVSFELTGGLTDEVRDAIRSGLKTTFTYAVELRLDVPAWVDRTIATANVAASVEYDNLTRTHNVVRMLDGRVEEALSTQDEAVVRTWMTNVTRFPLFSTSLLEPNRDYYIRVSATARPSNGSVFWPFGSGPSAQSRFTFIR